MSIFYTNVEKDILLQNKSTNRGICKLRNTNFFVTCTTLYCFHNFENSHHYIQIEFEVEDIFAKSRYIQGSFLYQKIN